MRIKRNFNLAICIFATVLFVCGIVTAAESASKAKTPKPASAANKQQAGKKPVWKRPAHHYMNQLTPAEFVELLKELYPKEAEKLADAKSGTPKNPKLYENRLKLMRKKHNSTLEAYKRNPEYGKALMAEKDLRSQRISLMGKLKNAKKEDAFKKYRAELSNVVSKEFDNNVKIKRFRYEELRARIKKMEEILAQREKEVKKLVERKDKEINNRIEELLKNEEKIKWK